MATKTLNDQFEATGGRPSGFDYLRIWLAVSVVIHHTVAVLHGPKAEIPYWLSPVGPYMAFIIPGFFALSGFLIASSLERNDLPSFLTLRGLRIFPALCVEVLLSALLIGPLVTTLPWADYFSSPVFHNYFLNVFGIIHYQLPGVFDSLPDASMVNAQLWTIPFELECYLAISVLALLGAPRYPRIFIAGLLLVVFAIFVRQILMGNPPGAYGPVGGRFSIFTFLFGIALYFLRKRIPFNIWLFGGALAISYVCLSQRTYLWLSPLAIAYVTIYLGLQNPRRIFLIKSADYSYGIYLYGLVIQQLVMFYLPASLQLWYVHLPISLALAAVCAWMSWTFVESQVLARKKPVLVFVGGVTRRVKGAFGVKLPASTSTKNS